MTGNRNFDAAPNPLTPGRLREVWDAGVAFLQRYGERPMVDDGSGGQRVDDSIPDMRVYDVSQQDQDLVERVGFPQGTKVAIQFAPANILNMSTGQLELYTGQSGESYRQGPSPATFLASIKTPVAGGEIAGQAEDDDAVYSERMLGIEQPNPWYERLDAETMASTVLPDPEDTLGDRPEVVLGSQRDFAIAKRMQEMGSAVRDAGRYDPFNEDDASKLLVLLFLVERKRR